MYVTSTTGFFRCRRIRIGRVFFWRYGRREDKARFSPPHPPQQGFFPSLVLPWENGSVSLAPRKLPGEEGGGKKGYGEIGRKFAKAVQNSSTFELKCISIGEFLARQSERPFPPPPPFFPHFAAGKSGGFFSSPPSCGLLRGWEGEGREVGNGSKWKPVGIAHSLRDWGVQ